MPKNPKILVSVGLLDSFTATAGNQKKKFKIDRNAQKLMIVRRGAASGAVMGRLLTQLPETLTIENQNTANQRASVADRIQLGFMASFAQYGEGLIPEISNTETVVTRLPVVLGRDAFGITGDDTFTLLMENLVVGYTYDVFALEAPATGSRYWQYQQGSILAGDHSKSLDLDAASAIILPNYSGGGILGASTGLIRASVTYATTSGDKICDYTMEELLFLNAENNDIETMSTHYATGQPVEVATSTVYGSMGSEVMVLMLGSIKHIVFHTDGRLIDYVTVTERSRLVQYS